MLRFYLIFLLAIPLRSEGQYLNAQTGAGSTMIANASVAQESVWSVFNNSSLCAFAKNVTLGLCYQNNYQIKELATQSLAAVIPLKNSALTTALQYFGNTHYNELRLASGYNKKLSAKASAGIQLNYYQSSSAGYGSERSVIPELSVFFKASDKWHFGGHVYNPLNTIFDKRSRNIPSRFRSGYVYKASEQVRWYGEADFSPGIYFIVKQGFSYSIEPSVSLSCGFSTKNGALFFGSRIKLYNQLYLELAASYIHHPGFVLSPALTSEF